MEVKDLDGAVRVVHSRVGVAARSVAGAIASAVLVVGLMSCTSGTDPNADQGSSPTVEPPPTYPEVPEENRPPTPPSEEDVQRWERERAREALDHLEGDGRPLVDFAESAMHLADAYATAETPEACDQLFFGGWGENRGLLLDYVLEFEYDPELPDMFLVLGDFVEEFIIRCAERSEDGVQAAAGRAEEMAVEIEERIELLRRLAGER